MADTLTLHNTPIDPDTVLAVERITFFFGFKPPEDDERYKRDERGGRYTTKALLVLKAKLPHPNDTHPSSNKPGTRYHLIAATHMGLRNTGKPIAKSLHVPYSHSSLGTFVKTIPTITVGDDPAATI